MHNEPQSRTDGAVSTRISEQDPKKLLALTVRINQFWKWQNGRRGCPA